MWKEEMPHLFITGSERFRTSADGWRHEPEIEPPIHQDRQQYSCTCLGVLGAPKWGVLEGSKSARTPPLEMAKSGGGTQGQIDCSATKKLLTPPAYKEEE